MLFFCTKRSEIEKKTNNSKKQFNNFSERVRRILIFINKEGRGLDTGGLDEDGIYYGYSLRELSFEKDMNEKAELTVSIYPKSITYLKNDYEVIEEIYDSRERNLTIKNEKYR